MHLLTRLVLDHPRRVVATVLLLAAVGCLAAVAVVSGATEQNRYPGLPAWEANDQIRAEYGTGGYQRPFVPVVRLPAGTTVPESAVALRAGLQALARRTGARVVSYADRADPVFLGTDPSVTFALVFPPYAETGGIPGSALGEVDDLSPQIRAALLQALPPGSEVEVTGLDTLSTGQDVGGLNVPLKIGIAALLALLVLGWVFRSALAIAPLLIAVVSTPIAALGLWLVSAVTPIHETSFMMAPLLAVGIAVDYALILVSRWREAQVDGAGPRAAVELAMRTAGRAVAVSGGVVAVGLASMVVLPIPIMRSLGLAGMVTVAASVVCSLTVLPVLLAWLGRRAEARGRVVRAASSSAVSPTWWRLAAWSVRRRWWVLAGAGTVLCGLCAATLTLNLATPATDRLAASGPARMALETLRDNGFPIGVVGSFDVLVPTGAPVLDRLAVDGVAAVLSSPSSEWNRADSSLLTVVPVAEPGTEAGRRTVEAVRTAAEGTPALVGGNAAQVQDYVTATYSAFPWMLTAVAAATFVLIAYAFRSAMLALKAIALNLLSLGAVLGVLVLVWQWGWGTELLFGLTADGTLGSFVPVTVFAFLFGLTMDYEVFQLARIREEYDRCGDTEQAVVRAIGKTGRLTSCAALILVFSFASMAMTREIDVAVFASGVALGILVDVTLIRGLLVPASVAALGAANWWWPSRHSWGVPAPAPRVARPRPWTRPGSRASR